MRRVQRPTPAPKKGRQQSRLPPPPPPAARQATQDDAIALILRGVPNPVRSVRVLIVGASQNGKTTFARKLCSALAGAGGVLVVHDHKFPDRAQYAGAQVHTADELRSAVMDADGHVIPGVVVCRPGVSAEDAATVVRDLAECGERATLLLDEPTPALKVNPETGEPMNQVWMGPNLTWLCIQGGGLGASLVMLCQLPRMVPASMLDNATVTVFFCTGGRSLAYSGDLRLLPREASPRVSSLSVGQLCPFFADRDWDGTVYGPN